MLGKRFKKLDSHLSDEVVETDKPVLVLIQSPK